MPVPSTHNRSPGISFRINPGDFARSSDRISYSRIWFSALA
ncbi:MAG TPA: hypothetical protein V6C85_19940 [Allocoleopsis sp.]